MLLAGSDDGVYRLSDPDGSAETTAERVLDSGRVLRLRTFDAVGGTAANGASEDSSNSLDGVFAATKTGLFHSHDGESWTDLGVPQERVYAVGASESGDRLYAGTKPAHVYVAELGESAGVDAEVDGLDAVEWRDLDDFQELPSRDEWRLPRHENLAQVRDIHRDPADPDRIVAGVEVGGVHVSDDGGETWDERREGVDDDIHELRVVGPGEYVAATGFGLFRTVDGGESWTRLDEGFDQRYFRTAFSLDGTIYAGGALANSSTWEDDDADPELFALREARPAGAPRNSERGVRGAKRPASREADRRETSEGASGDEGTASSGDALERVDFPKPDETVTGMTAVDGDLVVATHRGSVLADRPDGWTALGEIPVTDDFTGRYTPLTWVEG